VLSLPTLRPLDDDAILAAARRTGRVVTIEEHGRGGLGSAVAEVLACTGHPVPLRILRLPSAVIKTVGTQDYLRDRLGLTVETIVAAVEAP